MTSMMDQNSSFVLAKVNIDEMGEVASAMGVQSIPHVFLIHKAEVLDSFVGIPQ
jgi:thioredoxin-like negative regulator of GroEL